MPLTMAQGIERMAPDWREAAMKAKKKRTPRLMRLIMAGYVVLAIVTIAPRALQVMELEQKREVFAAQNQELIALKAEREERLAEIQSLSHVERVAREQLGMIKEGERPLVKAVPVQ